MHFSLYRSLCRLVFVIMLLHLGVFQKKKRGLEICGVFLRKWTMLPKDLEVPSVPNKKSFPPPTFTTSPQIPIHIAVRTASQSLNTRLPFNSWWLIHSFETYAQICASQIWINSPSMEKSNIWDLDDHCLTPKSFVSNGTFFLQHDDFLLQHCWLFDVLMGSCAMDFNPYESLWCVLGHAYPHMAYPTWAPRHRRVIRCWQRRLRSWLNQGWQPKDPQIEIRFLHVFVAIDLDQLKFIYLEHCQKEKQANTHTHKKKQKRSLHSYWDGQ